MLVHTGQHYDRMMSGIFLEQLGVPEPDHMLGVGSGSHAAQLGGVLEAIAPVLAAEEPDLVIVPGDVNSTLAAALACAHLRIPLAHVEAGLRSFDRTMPEEVNRVLTDQVSDLLFTHSPEAAVNLDAEGIGAERVHLVGNTMIDSLVALEGEFRDRGACAAHGLEPGSYLLVTLHRPALVDGPLLGSAIDALGVRLGVDAGRSSRSTRGRGRRSAPPPTSFPPACGWSTRSAISTSSRSRPMRPRS